MTCRKATGAGQKKKTLNLISGRLRIGWGRTWLGSSEKLLLLDSSCPGERGLCPSEPPSLPPQNYRQIQTNFLHCVIWAAKRVGPAAVWLCQCPQTVHACALVQLGLLALSDCLAALLSDFLPTLSARAFQGLLFFPSNAFMASARSLHMFNRSKKMNCNYHARLSTCR